MKPFTILVSSSLVLHPANHSRCLPLFKLLSPSPQLGKTALLCLSHPSLSCTPESATREKVWVNGRVTHLLLSSQTWYSYLFFQLYMESPVPITPSWNQSPLSNYLLLCTSSHLSHLLKDIFLAVLPCLSLTIKVLFSTGSFPPYNHVATYPI